MSIALRTGAAWALGANSLTPGIVTSQLTGDMMILIAVGKPFGMGWSVPGDWTSLGSAASGSTAASTDVGSMKAEVWYKIATSDGEADPAVVEGSPIWNVAGTIVLVFSKGASETWETPVVRFAGDETTGTALSFSFATDPGGAAGDYVALACGINTDAMGPLTTDLAPTWTGITFGTADAAIEGETIAAGDMAAHAITLPVSSGTSSAAPSMAGTGTATGGADKAEGVFIRLRVAAVQIANYGIAAETDTALSFTGAKHATYGVAAETDAALGFLADRRHLYGVSAEADTALPFTGSVAGAGQTAQYGVAAELDTALPFETSGAPPQTVQYGVAAEVDTALAFETRTVGPAGVIFPMGSIHSPFLLKPISRRRNR